jgi:hypothetical protein
MHNLSFLKTCDGIVDHNSVEKAIMFQVFKNISSYRPTYLLGVCLKNSKHQVTSFLFISFTSTSLTIYFLRYFSLYCFFYLYFLFMYVHLSFCNYLLPSFYFFIYFILSFSQIR